MRVPVRVEGTQVALKVLGLLVVLVLAVAVVMGVKVLFNDEQVLDRLMQRFSEVGGGDGGGC